MSDAARDYARITTDLRALVARLPEVLDAHAARQQTTPAFWTHVGDVKRARLDVLHVMAFLGDLEAREILHAEGESR